MNALEARKQLLLVESELNRAKMIGEIRALTKSGGVLVHHATAWETIAASAMAMGLAAWRHTRPDEGTARSFRRHAIRQGAALLATLWLGFRQRRRR